MHKKRGEGKGVEPQDAEKSSAMCMQAAIWDRRSCMSDGAVDGGYIGIVNQYLQ